MAYKLSKLSVPLIEQQFDHRKEPMEFAVRLRLSVELLIATKLIEIITNDGYQIAVYDGETTCLSRTDDVKKIVAAIMSTDEDRLIVIRPDGQGEGSIHLIYGNDGHDVIHDYTTNCERWVKAVEKELGL